MNVGSGGGGAAAAPSGGTSGGAAADAPDEEAKKEEKEEGNKLDHLQSRTCTLTSPQQRKRNRTKIWALGSLTKFLDLDHSFGGSLFMTSTP